jgi:hypothetical protein
MQTLNQSEEDRLLQAVKQAVDYVDNEGLHPDDALTKVARDLQLKPGFVRSAVSAYNNGRQVAQFRSGTDILTKLAEFPLADYDKIYRNIWGGTVKQAQDACQTPQRISPEYSAPPGFIRNREREKLAAMDLLPLRPALPPLSPEHQAAIEKHASDRRMQQAFGQYKLAQQHWETARAKHAHAHDVVRARLGLLRNYFAKLAMDRLPFDVFETAVETYHGAAGKSLVAYLAHAFPKEKRAADSRQRWDRPLNRAAEPFSFVTGCIDAARQVQVTKTALDESWQNYQRALEAVAPFAQPPSPQNLNPFALVEPGEKQAFFGMAGGAAVASGTRALLDRALGPQATGDQVEKTWLALENPSHENELRRIRSETMLAELMNDRDSPISGYQPHEVYRAYNELSQIAPRAAEQPAALRTLLAKRLAGNLEPFEIQEITNLEKGLKDTKETTPLSNQLLMSNAPKSLLG